MKLFIKTSVMNRQIHEAELNIIRYLERMPINKALIDEIVEIVANELEKIVIRK